MILTTNTYCDNNTGDHLLYIQANYYDFIYVKNVYVKTGQKVNDRPEYQNIGDANVKICFRDNKWVITYYNIVTWYNKNPRQGLTPPKKGWLDKDGTAVSNITIHLVPKIPPPPVLSIQGDFILGLAGIYTLSNTTHIGYPYYQNSHGSISVQEGYGYPHVNGDKWYWEDSKTGETIQISDSVPPSYTPAGWNEWKKEEYENKTLVLFNGLFCSTSNFTGYFIWKSHKHFCDKKPDCKNNVDEKDCFEIRILESMLIALGIVLVGVGLFLMLHYSHVLVIHCTNITMSGTVANIQDDIIDNITIGRLSNISK